MIKPLRKKHLHIWLTLALLLPAAIMRAWLVQPLNQVNATQHKAAGSAVTNIADSTNNKVDTINF